MEGQVRDVDGKPVAGADRRRLARQHQGRLLVLRPLAGEVQPAPPDRDRRRGPLPVPLDPALGLRLPAGRRQTQALLDQLGRHGNRPAHIHFFVSAAGLPSPDDADQHRRRRVPARRLRLRDPRRADPAGREGERRRPHPGERAERPLHRDHLRLRAARRGRRGSGDRGAPRARPGRLSAPAPDPSAAIAAADASPARERCHGTPPRHAPSRPAARPDRRRHPQHHRRRADGAAAQALATLGFRPELRHRRDPAGERRDRRRRGRHPRRAALERGERRGHQGRHRRPSRAGRARRRREPVRSGGRPHGRGGQAQQRRQGRDRERALRRGRPHARGAGGAAARRRRAASGCRSSGRLPRATRRRRSRRPRRSSPRACTTASRSRSARSRLRTTSPGCAGSRRRSRGARR